MVQISSRPIDTTIKPPTENIETVQNLGIQEQLIIHFSQYWGLYLAGGVVLGILSYIYIILNKRNANILLQRYYKSIDECKQRATTHYITSWKFDLFGNFLKGKPVFLINDENLNILGMYLGQRFTEKYFDLLIFSKQYLGFKKNYRIIRFDISKGKNEYKEYLIDKPNGLFIRAIEIKKQNDYFSTPLLLNKDNKIVDFSNEYIENLEKEVKDLTITELLQKQKGMIDKALTVNPEFNSKKKMSDIEIEMEKRNFKGVNH